MLKSILLIITMFTFPFTASLLAAEDHATYSLQRWQDKLVVTIAHDEGWHTYWKNPGDAGIASKFVFSQKGKPVDLKDHEWPTPKRYIESGDILTVGYSGKKHFFFGNVPSGTLEAKIGVLICKDVCIPGEANLKLEETQKYVANRKSSEFSDAELKEAFNNLPQITALPSGFEYYLTRDKDQNILTLHYSIKGAEGAKFPQDLMMLTGFPHPPFGYKREKLYFDGKTYYGKTNIEWDGEYMTPEVPLPASGNFKTPYDLKFLINAPGAESVKVIQLQVKDFSLATPALDEFYKKLKPFEIQGKGTTPSAGKPQETVTKMEGSYLRYILFAFLGGLILNLMPCVLPVISIKLFGLIKHKEYTQRKLFSHNLSYTAGVISTFMVLAAVIAGIKVTGEEVGWGFQLQSPVFILVMMLVLFILSLNMFGLFEFSTPGGSKFGSVTTQEGFSGDFFSGVLTTILSTPCSAPFLGTALTFAFTTSYYTIFIMFFFIGLGLAFPFLMTAAFPKSLNIFPRPGIWMEKLKYFLGFTLIATIIWLYDVFVSLVNFEVLSWRLNFLFALWFFAFFFAKKISNKKTLQFFFFAIPLSLTVMAAQNLELRPSFSPASSSKSSEVNKAGATWIPWSEEKMNDQKGNLVFVDFTAEWCITCKVNKKLVLETQGFEKLREKYNIVLMRADWTRRDDNITQFLKRHDTVGVPAYFIQKADGALVALGETITLSKIESHLQ